ncbi:MAG: hypothetical protein ACFFD4_01935 [Candidatus Odinarchaeota archaeon]
MNSLLNDLSPRVTDLPGSLALIDEHIATRIELYRILWDKNIGLEVDDSHIQEISKKREEIAKKIIKTPFNPANTFYEIYSSTQNYRYMDVNLRIANYRNNNFSCKDVLFNKLPVNRNTWYPWLMSPAADDDSARKKIFDTFVTQLSGFKKLIEELFLLDSQILDELGLNYGKYFQAINGVSLDKVKSFLKAYLDGLKPYLPDLYRELTMNYFNREPKYYDDPWSLTLLATRLLSESTRKSRDFFETVISFCKNMGYDLSKLTFDTEKREKKHSNAFCTWIKVPDDIRVSLHGRETFMDFYSVLHELGHALHLTSTDPKLPPYKRYYGHFNMFLEVPSILFGEYLVSKQDFRVKFLGNETAEFTEAFTAQSKAYYLFSYPMLATLSLAKLRFFEKKCLGDVETEFKRLNDKYFGIPLTSDFCYLIATAEGSFASSAVYIYSMGVMAGLAGKLAATHGEQWWEEPGAHEKLRSIWSNGPAIGEVLPAADPEECRNWILEATGLQ